MRRWELRWTGPLPPNMNGSASPFARVKNRRLWRANALVLAVAAELPRREIVRYRVTGQVYRRNLGVADPDGDISRFKSVIDGLVAEKYLPEDNYRFVEWAPPEESHGVSGFTLVLEELLYDDETAERARQRYARDDSTDPLDAVRRLHRRSATGAAAFRALAAPNGSRRKRRHPRGERGSGLVG